MQEERRDIIYNLVSVESFRKVLKRSNYHIKIKSKRFWKQLDHVEDSEDITKTL